MVPSTAEPRIFKTNDTWITVRGVTMRRSRSWRFSLHALHTSSDLGLEFQTCVLLLHVGGETAFIQFGQENADDSRFVVAFEAVLCDGQIV